MNQAEENYMSRQREKFGYVLMNPEQENGAVHEQLIPQQSEVFNDS